MQSKKRQLEEYCRNMAKINRKWAEESESTRLARTYRKQARDYESQADKYQEEAERQERKAKQKETNLPW